MMVIAYVSLRLLLKAYVVCVVGLLAGMQAVVWFALLCMLVTVL